MGHKQCNGCVYMYVCEGYHRQLTHNTGLTHSPVRLSESVGCQCVFVYWLTLFMCVFECECVCPSVSVLSVSVTGCVCVCVSVFRC